MNLETNIFYHYHHYYRKRVSNILGNVYNLLELDIMHVSIPLHKQIHVSIIIMKTT